ncbi:hypothetical protein L6164_011090 [Bauhinia variegata]|uniref:Uncharacterized protein n=1 Tax=Bauhinia variegata TaxID=167791 RepID=A0ACB9P4S4_BAUVA|nr:hypothetical protein L6164_011090 [Bauhinia variegata]
MNEQKGHVIVLPYPAQGHINPMLQFAKRLISKGVKATLATTPYTIKYIDASSVHVEPISDGYDEGGFKFAPSVEAYLESFKSVGSRTLSELILKFRESPCPANCIVYDSLFPWALDVAQKFGIYKAVFLTNSASVCSIYWHIKLGRLNLPLDKEMFPISLPGLPPLHSSDLPSFIARPADHSAYLAAIMEKFEILEHNDWVLCNTFQELESEVWLGTVISSITCALIITNL